MADKAAIFGVNQYKSVPSVNGCVNDVQNMQSLVPGVFGFDPKNVKTFTASKVTKGEVMRQLKWLFRDVAPGDRVVFHFSGHGSNVPDTDGDETDGADDEEPQSFVHEHPVWGWHARTHASPVEKSQAPDATLTGQVTVRDRTLRVVCAWPAAKSRGAIWAGFSPRD